MREQHDVATLKETQVLHSAEEDCEANGYKVHLLCVEVGRRGHVSQSFEWMCKVLGLDQGEAKREEL